MIGESQYISLFSFSAISAVRKKADSLEPFSENITNYSIAPNAKEPIANWAIPQKA
ncbi:hypothetical protein QUA62_16490 [Microcoleus sp. MON1_C1]|uniref:hypothetical protein n=1 Tax=Microcoleus sp. MON1_C1 TaxID=2818827 RepID=UPI002FD0B0CE